MQELVWLIGNDVDLEKAKINQFFRFPYLEIGPMITPATTEKVKKILLQTLVTSIDPFDLS